jgi:Arc/MetJ-type ribon-helix-helix transcriptional regulator
MADERGEVDVVKTLELALSKAASLPEAAQEALGRELLERIDELTRLRAEIETGLKELDAGLGKKLDVEELLRDLHAEHAREKK